MKILIDITRRGRLLLSLLSGLLMVPAWYTWGSGVVLFVAFVPLLIIEDNLSGRSGKAYGRFWLPALSFLILNILASWWIKNASFAGLLVALMVNTFMMTLPFWLYSLTRRKLGNRLGYFSFVAYWVAMEYLYLNAEISWTWFNLGNGFANDIRIIQWYEYTGTLGGTLWVLVINLQIFFIIKGLLGGSSRSGLGKLRIATVAIIVVPVILSLIRFATYTEKEDPYEIVVVQPNIDPYEKFNDMPVQQQIDIYMRIADSLATPETDYIVAPETFINDNIWLHYMNASPAIDRLLKYSYKHPGAEQVLGITCYGLYQGDERSATAQHLRDDLYYDSFNTAIQIDTTGNIPHYHKSQLVVGVEKMPYPKLLGFLRKLMLNLGGTFRSHGEQDFRDTFEKPGDGNRVAPVICYESIFGEYVTEYIKEAEGDFIFVITNDGWWGDTPGYKQHFSYSSLRAIENRRSLARSANTGISAFINQRGEVIDSLGWWVRSGIRATLNANDRLTFYTRHGDYLGRVALFMFFLLFGYTLFRFIKPWRG